ncbi:MAG: flavodoxin family protein [Thermodesulfobacteriota bacterium]|nr:flavodoxin family protein [Thermodesulfobacteriota bacterium]
MGKKLLGIIGSYRKRGNSEIAAKAIAREMGGEWDLSLVRLAKLSVKPCKGCYACLIPDQACNIKDDVEWLFEEIASADAVIMAAPNYVMGPVGMVKMLSDRVLQAARFHEQFAHIPTAVILTMGLEKYNGIAQTGLCMQTASLGLNVMCAHSFVCTHPGEIALTGDFEKRIAAIAGLLATGGGEKAAGPGQCPRCLSDLFRPHPDGGLECAVCKSLATQNGTDLEFYAFDPEFTKEGQMKHMEWLLGKKEEYNRLKDRLREIREKYKDGEWERPDAPV